MISDNGKNFVSDETLVRSTKTLLKKNLQNYRLSYDEMQTVLFEVEMILNNCLLTYV